MAAISEAFAAALQHHQAGRLHDAERLYRQILGAEPNHADALHLLGLIAHQVGQHGAAVDLIRRAIAVKGDAAIFHNNLGQAYRGLGRTSEAAASYRRAIELSPGFAEPHNNLGSVLQEQGRLGEAMACFRRAVEINPNYAEAHANLAYAYNNLASLLARQRRLDEALACCRRALELKPEFAEACVNLGVVLCGQGKLDEAVACYRRALELRPDFVEAHHNLGSALKDQGKLDEALACFRNALRLGSDSPGSLASMVHQLQHLCCWQDINALAERVIQTVDGVGGSAAENPVSPFHFLALPLETTAEQQLRCARRWAEGRLPAGSTSSRHPVGHRPPPSQSKITVGYLSADFHAHATARLIAELIERHDRRRLAVFGYDYGPDDQSPTRRRLVNAFDRFVDLGGDSFADAARRIAADGVDILVDLKGHTKGVRTEIMALRPAPIQVHYLGYPGTIGGDFMDYILVDDYIVPPRQQPFFTEKLVFLPGCYQVNDSRREISARPPSREECRLPAQRFVFCAFNNSYKITPAMFGVWMRLLAAVPGSVLWLLEGNRFITAHLHREAEARGIAAERLVMAPRVPLVEHLARHRLADLFLDTFPVTAHTTASDALWAGCPLLTLGGETFVSRVAGSLLRTIGLPELIATSLEDYEARALRLARDPRQLAALRTRLEANRLACGLFDGGRFARNLEEAYATMWEIHLAGEAPRSFAIDDKPEIANVPAGPARPPKKSRAIATDSAQY